MTRPAGSRACAHRGDSWALRENTLPAVRSALAKGAAVVEIDVRLTADGDVVVLHDPTLARLWGDPRASATVHCAPASKHAFVWLKTMPASADPSARPGTGRPRWR